MAIVNGSLQEGYKDAAWFSANPTLVLKQGQRVNLLQTGTYKLGDGVTQLSALSFLGGGGTVDVNTIGAAINGAITATPNDTDLVMSVESSVAKKNTWTQVKAFLKTYFDTVYTTTASVATQITTALSSYVKKGTLTTNTIPKATSSDTIGDSSITDNGTQVTVNNGFYVNSGGAEVAAQGNTAFISADQQSNTNIESNLTENRLLHNIQNTFDAPLSSFPHLTASQLIATDASKNLQSLDTSIYPSLTELSYGKGVTSAIQTQLNEIRQGRKYFAYNNTTYSYTGTTANTILRTIYIPANSMNLNSTLELHAIFGKSGTAGTMNYAAYITTNPSVITGGSIVKINAFAAGNLQGGFVLRITNKNALNSQAVQLPNSGANQYDTWQTANFARTLLSIDFAVDQYIHIYSTLGNATDTAIIYDYQCYIDKN